MIFFKILSSTILVFLFTCNSLFAQEYIPIYNQMVHDYDSSYYDNIIAKEKDLLKYKNIPDSLMADVYSYLGEAYLMNFDLSKSKLYFEKELVFRKNFEPLIQEKYNASLYNLGTVQLEMGNLKSALITADDLLEADKRLYGETSEEYLQTVEWYLELLLEDSQFDKALKIVNKCINNIEKDNFYYPVLLTKKADVAMALGKYDQADVLLRSAINIFNNLNNSIDKISSQLLLAINYTYEGKYPMAEEIFIESKNELIELDDQNVQYIIDDLNSNLAKVYRALSRYQDAVELYDIVLKNDIENYGYENPNYLLTVNDQALTYLAMKEYQNAENIFKNALEINENVFGSESLMYAKLKNNIANLYRLDGRVAEAILTYEEALVAFKKVYGKNENTDEATVNFNMGKAHLSIGDKRAEKHLKQALKMRESLLGTSHPKYSEATNYLGIYYWQKKDVDKANQYFDETFKNYFEQIRSFFSVLSEEEKSAFYEGKLKPTFEQYNSYAWQNYKNNPELMGKVYNLQLQTKGLIMYATDKVRSSIYNQKDTLLIKQYENWRSLKERISKLYSSNLASEQKKIDSLKNESNTLERQLVKASATFADANKVKVPTWQQIRDQLKPGEVAVEIIRYRVFDPNKINEFTKEVNYLALIVKPDTKDYPKAVLLNNGNDLEDKFINNYRNSIKFKVDDNYSYDNFWNQISTEIGEADKLYFSPDGVYNQININTLKNPNSGKYLVDELRVRQVTNTKEILNNENTSSIKTDDAYFIGFPSYTQNTKEHRSNSNESISRGGLSRGLRGGLMRYLRSGEGIAPLPGTKVEIESIAEIYKKKNNQSPKIIMQNEASEASIKSVDNPKILHIATHGFFLANSEEAEIENSGKYFENPLLRSGIVLAGAEDFLTDGQLLEANQDGVLTAYEAMNLNLNQTDLVVLSACETGLGTLKNGEGVYGLQRAFQLAGAKSVIMSMWNVDDDATQELMSNFYSNWISGMDRNEAFHKSQLELKKKYTSPFYWGAFVMVGK